MHVSCVLNRMWAWALGEVKCLAALQAKALGSSVPGEYGQDSAAMHVSSIVIAWGFMPGMSVLQPSRPKRLAAVYLHDVVFVIFVHRG